MECLTDLEEASSMIKVKGNEIEDDLWPSLQCRSSSSRSIIVELELFQLKEEGKHLLSPAIFSASPRKQAMYHVPGSSCSNERAEHDPRFTWNHGIIARTAEELDYDRIWAIIDDWNSNGKHQRPNLSWTRNKIARLDLLWYSAKFPNQIREFVISISR